MTFNGFIKRISGARRNGLGAPVLRTIIPATRRVFVAPLAPFMPDSAVRP